MRVKKSGIQIKCVINVNKKMLFLNRVLKYFSKGTDDLFGGHFT